MLSFGFEGCRCEIAYFMVAIQLIAAWFLWVYGVSLPAEGHEMPQFKAKITLAV